MELEYLTPWCKYVTKTILSEHTSNKPQSRTRNYEIF